MTKAQQENFERAFSTGGGGCRRECACGKEYFNPSGDWSWEDGELEKLRDDPNATAVEYAIGGILFQGREYANACTCWEPLAEKFIGFIDDHGREVAKYVNLEKARLVEEAQRTATQAPEIK